MEHRSTREPQHTGHLTKTGQRPVDLAAAQEEPERAQLGEAAGHRRCEQSPAEGDEEVAHPGVADHQAAIDRLDRQVLNKAADRERVTNWEAQLHRHRAPAAAIDGGAANVSLQPRASARGSRPRIENRLPGQTPSSMPWTTPRSSVSRT